MTSRGNLVGTATSYGLDTGESWSDPRQGQKKFLFSKSPRPVLKTIHVERVAGTLSLGGSGRGLNLTARLHLVTRLRTSGAVLPLITVFLLCTKTLLPLTYSTEGWVGLRLVWATWNTENLYFCQVSKSSCPAQACRRLFTTHNIRRHAVSWGSSMHSDYNALCYSCTWQQWPHDGHRCEATRRRSRVPQVRTKTLSCLLYVVRTALWDWIVCFAYPHLLPSVLPFQLIKATERKCKLISMGKISTL